MAELRRAWVSLVLASMIASSARGNSPVTANWHTDARRAWQAAQQTGRPLLVFVTRADCLHCAKMRQGTFADPRVSAGLASDYIPLVLDGAKATPLLNDLRVQVFPSTFIISPRAIILARWEGYLPPKTLSDRLTAVSRARLLATNRPR